MHFVQFEKCFFDILNVAKILMMTILSTYKNKKNHLINITTHEFICIAFRVCNRQLHFLYAVKSKEKHSHPQTKNKQTQQIKSNLIKPIFMECSNDIGIIYVNNWAQIKANVTNTVWLWKWILFYFFCSYHSFVCGKNLLR